VLTLDPALPRLESVWAARLPELSRPVEPPRVPRPSLLALSDDLAHELQIDPGALRGTEGLHVLTDSGQTDARDDDESHRRHGGQQCHEHRDQHGRGTRALDPAQERHGALARAEQE